MKSRFFLAFIIFQMLVADSASAMFSRALSELREPAARVVRTSLRQSSFKYPEYVEQGYLCPSYCQGECMAKNFKECSLLTEKDRLELRMLEEQDRRNQWREEVRAQRRKGFSTMLAWAGGTAVTLTALQYVITPLPSKKNQKSQ